MRILMVAALLAAGILFGWPGTASAGAQSACADLGGTVGGDQICRGHAANSTYMLDFSFPVDYPDQQALTDYLTQTREGFINVSEMPDSRDKPYVLDAKGTAYRSGTPPRGTQSVVFEIYQNVGGAHPQTWYKAFNYDLSKRAPVTFDTLFKPGTEPLRCHLPGRTGRTAEAERTRGRGPARRRSRSGELPELRTDRRCGDLLLRSG